MKIVINRSDLVTKKKICEILKNNRLVGSDFRSSEFVKGWDTCIDEMIEVINREHI